MDIEKLLTECYRLATHSPDPSNQNGALVVDADGEAHVGGFNHFPRGLDVTPELIADRDWKLAHIAHAEEAATYNAASAGVPTTGMVLVCPWAACLSCCRAILLGDYRKLIVHKQRMDTTPERWKASVDDALDWLRLAGVEIEYFDGKLPNAPMIKVNAEDWQP